ncbi:hypothetical protein niasHT_000402 [Heterodera trifolii]|uniref:Uncharacterized protein n=1 Tax=Heterodera trifolii TaxID=157864 RepID=A0ABD2M1A6_9BILA
MCADLAASELKWVFLKIHYFGRKINWAKRRSLKKQQQQQIEYEVQQLLKLIEHIREKYPDKTEISSLDILRFVQEMHGGMANGPYGEWPYRSFNMWLMQHQRRNTMAFMPQSIDALKFADEMDQEEEQLISSSVNALLMNWRRQLRSGQQNTFIPLLPLFYWKLKAALYHSDILDSLLPLSFPFPLLINLSSVLPADSLDASHVSVNIELKEKALVDPLSLFAVDDQQNYSENDPLQQNGALCSSVVWSVGLFQRHHFRNGTIGALCLECGQVLWEMDTDAQLTDHIVNKHPEYMPNSLAANVAPATDLYREGGARNFSCKWSSRNARSAYNCPLWGLFVPEHNALFRRQNHNHPMPMRAGRSGHSVVPNSVYVDRKGNCWRKSLQNGPCNLVGKANCGRATNAAADTLCPYRALYVAKRKAIFHRLEHNHEQKKKL